MLENTWGRLRSNRARVTSLLEFDASAPAATTRTSVPTSQGASFLNEMFLIRFTSASRNVSAAQGDEGPDERNGTPNGGAEGAPDQRAVEAGLSEQSVPGLERCREQEGAQRLDAAERAA